MPTYLRNFYYKKLVSTKDEEKKNIDKTKAKMNSRSKPSIPKNPRFKR
jgi:hypothetical protein